MKAGAGTRLEPVLESVRARLEQRRRALPLAELRARVRPDARRRERFLARFVPGELGLICELKRRSPSAGELLRPGVSYPDLARAYEDGGASALSVLTEEDHFGGSLADLEVLAPIGLPMLRKDFVLDESMLLEAALHGAYAVLLIAAILEDGLLRDLRQAARALGLAVLLEVHDERELERALPHAPELLGVNARDLTTLVTDLRTPERLLPLVPAGPLRVAESGLKNAQDLRRVRAAGADGVLVGEALVQSKDPGGTLRGWREALRG